MPRLQMGTKWEGSRGFAAMLLLLSCLGSDGEYVLWDEGKRDSMTEEEWKRRKFKSTSKPPILHEIIGVHWQNIRVLFKLASMADGRIHDRHGHVVESMSDFHVVVDPQTSGALARPLLHAVHQLCVARQLRDLAT